MSIWKIKVEHNKLLELLEFFDKVSEIVDTYIPLTPPEGNVFLDLSDLTSLKIHLSQEFVRFLYKDKSFLESIEMNEFIEVFFLDKEK
jgi:hypothetical protein